MLTGYSDRVEVPEELLELVRVETASLVGEKLGAQAEMLYLQDKKGRNIATQSMNIFPGMPFSSKGSVMKAAQKKYYIKIYADIAPQVKVTANVNPSKSKNKPRIEMRVEILDEAGAIFFTNRVVLRDFDVLRSQSRVRGKVRITTSDVLSPEDIVEMYLLALESALFGE